VQRIRNRPPEVAAKDRLACQHWIERRIRPATSTFGYSTYAVSGHDYALYPVRRGPRGPKCPRSGDLPGTGTAVSDSRGQRLGAQMTPALVAAREQLQAVTGWPVPQISGISSETGRGSDWSEPVESRSLRVVIPLNLRIRARVPMTADQDEP
jgi:hypothetical protein